MLKNLDLKKSIPRTQLHKCFLQKKKEEEEII